MGGSREGTGGPDPPEKSEKCRVSLQYLPRSPKNHKATKQAFNVGSLSAHQRDAISMAFCWRADDGTFVDVVRSSILSPT